MVKKVKQLASQEADGQFVASVRDSANQIWLAGLGAFAKAQEEGAKFFDTLVQEGEKVQKRATKAAGDKITEVKEQATGTWGKLERVFEDRVGRALHGLNVPTKKDVDVLARRVSELTAVTKKLTASMGAEAAPKARPRAAAKHS
ncbi:MAG: phasin family protein [Hyphomicrobiales bacterium]|jgi:poly(hydroxyalkanoate) granule-associated protein